MLKMKYLFITAFIIHVNDIRSQSNSVINSIKRVINTTTTTEIKGDSVLVVESKKMEKSFFQNDSVSIISQKREDLILQTNLKNPK